MSEKKPNFRVIENFFFLQSSPRRVAVPVLVKDGKPCSSGGGEDSNDEPPNNGGSSLLDIGHPGANHLVSFLPKKIY